MLIIINILILCVVLFTYIHIYNHIKTSNYLEIYEIENPSKDKLEDLIAIKQPVVLNNMNLSNITIDYLKTNYPTFELSLYSKENDLFIKIKLEEFIKLITSNKDNAIITYNNSEFLEETTIEKQLATSDLFLRPYNMFSKKYDLFLGKINSVSRLKYSINSRNIIYVTQGKIELTLCPPKEYKYLHVKKNYETLEFYSEINIYNVEPKYYDDYNKVKFLRIILEPNQVLLIPPYWFYSIKLLEENCVVFCNTYTTYMGCLATVPDLIMQTLQQDNLKLNNVKQFTNNQAIMRENACATNQEIEPSNNQISNLSNNQISNQSN